MIDNRPGASGTIGTDLVAKSTPDGHTLLIKRLYEEFRTALAVPDIQSRFTALGTETVGMPPDEFTRVFHGDLQRWAKFVKETGLKLD